jgi:hypothetical protein
MYDAEVRATHQARAAGTGIGHERVRGLRPALAGTEREEALATIRGALANRPKL